MDLERWLRLMEAWRLGRNQETYDALAAAYTEVGRHYHTNEHISACLRHLNRCAELLDHPREVEIALWFHDAIYEPLSSNNEKKSADWATSFLSGEGVDGEAVARVYRLIVATEHNAPTQTKDESVLVDIDLSILGADSDVYDIFEANVRKEYRLVPWFIYRKKRAEVLRAFMDRPSIYINDFFADALERQARQNLSAAISRLEGRT